jgi:type II secretory pathway pseudopilin PulG
MTFNRPLLAIAALSIATSAVAAQSTAERPRAKAAMWVALQLTESQQSRVKEIHARYAPAVKATQKQAKDSAARINDRELAEVRSMLTAEQQQTFDSYMSGKKRARRGSVARLMPVKIGISH